ncbi:MAG TPA: hypothetical protein VM223_09660 [Planctomycetota bacterium]|nr:hypothetical protein [Planctomycetota bacterium]
MDPHRTPQPLYTPATCSPSHRLTWSLAVFWRDPMPAPDWLAQLRSDLAPDGIHLLEHNAASDNVSQFLLSSMPHRSPAEIVRLTKGRLQYLVRSTRPKPFRRNYWIGSVGPAGRDEVQRYVRSQLTHHRMADPRVQRMLERFQFSGPGVDLSKAQFSAHGEFMHNLHLVFVHDARWAEVREDELTLNNETVLRVAEKRGHRVSAIGVFADHMHLSVGCNIDDAPGGVALSYMNNLVYRHGMRPLYMNGYYAGTFGEYDLWAIRRRVREMRMDGED